MNLNLEILREDLRDIVVSGVINGSRLERPFAFAVIYSGETRPLGDRLYLARAGDLPAEIDLEESPSFLCIGAPPLRYINGQCNILVCRDDLLINDLLTRITELFQYYHSWELELLKANNKKLSPKILGLLSEPLFGNPLSLFDASMKCLFRIVDSEKYPIPDYYVAYADNTYLELENINMLKYDREFMAANEKKEPAIYPADIYGFRSLYINIFLEGKCAARLLVDEIARPFTGRDFALIAVLGEAVKTGLEMKAALSQWYPKDLDEITAKLLEHRFVDEKELTAVLQDTGWNMEDTYFCVTIEPSEFDFMNKTLASLAGGLSSLVPGNCYRISDNTITYLFNVSAVKLSREAIQERLLPHLRDSFLRAGISTTYTGFMNSYFYYQQSLIALRLGKKRRQDLWYYRFDDYALDYITETSMRGLVPEALCPEGLLRLRRHDQEQGTDYLRLLRAYLENNMHALQTQQNLAMHRNTFYFRLNRLREILDMNLEDPDIRLRLTLAFRFLDAPGGSAAPPAGAKLDPQFKA
ncbi:MAG: helix-turn-helix domain-containing protein [Treponema sp.]|nr:helix-turn-helix domain-containing protein [Treponema sp.]